MPNGLTILRAGACVIVLAGLVAGCNRENHEKEGREGRGGGHGIRKACMADIEKYCGNFEKRREQRECLQTNEAKLSPDCKAALDARGGGRRERDNE